MVGHFVRPTYDAFQETPSFSYIFLKNFVQLSLILIFSKGLYLDGCLLVLLCCLDYAISFHFHILGKYWLSWWLHALKYMYDFRRTFFSHFLLWASLLLQNDNADSLIVHFQNLWTFLCIRCVWFGFTLSFKKVTSHFIFLACLVFHKFISLFSDCFPSTQFFLP